MWDAITHSALWGGTGYVLTWLITGSLIIVGLAGCVLPALPGHLLILLAATVHWLLLGPERAGIEWWSLVILAAIMAISQIIEFMSGAAGSRWFGGSRWGSVGALIGSIVGLFFLPLGLLVGPLLGAILAEVLLARRGASPAARSGVGSVVGTLAGIAIKTGLGVVMIGWFFLDVFWIN